MKHKRLYKSLLTLTLLCISSFEIQAMEVCHLLETPIVSDDEKSNSRNDEKNIKISNNLTNQQRIDYLANLKTECELSNMYTNLEKKVQKKYRISLENISVYQALRYVQRRFYLSAASADIPLPYVYQKLKNDYNKPISQRSTEIWDNWQVGIKQLSKIREDVINGKNFDLEQIKKVHKNFYIGKKNYISGTEEIGDFSNTPFPGELKPVRDSAGPEVIWWSFKSEAEVLSAKSQTDKQNNYFRELGFLPALHSSSDLGLLDLIRIEKNDGVYSIYPADQRTLLYRLELILDFMNQMLELGRLGKHLEWKGRLLTPAQVAYLIQQYFIGIHPFHEGNGRVSRFLQELVLTSFALPHGASGDIMDDDVLTVNSDYYKMAIEKSFTLLKEAQNCVENVYTQAGFYRLDKINEADQQSLPYNCRIIK